MTSRSFHFVRLIVFAQFCEQYFRLRVPMNCSPHTGHWCSVLCSRHAFTWHLEEQKRCPLLVAVNCSSQCSQQYVSPFEVTIALNGAGFQFLLHQAPTGAFSQRLGVPCNCGQHPSSVGCCLGALRVQIARATRSSSRWRYRACSRCLPKSGHRSAALVGARHPCYQDCAR